MTRLFFAACISSCLLFLIHAVFTNFYETGYSVFISPVLFIGFSVPFVAILFRQRWSWNWVFSMSLMSVLLNSIFPPTPVYFGEVTTFARMLIGAEVLMCLIVLFCMFRPAVKNWFGQAHKA